MIYTHSTLLIRQNTSKKKVKCENNSQHQGVESLKWTYVKLLFDLELDCLHFSGAMLIWFLQFGSVLRFSLCVLLCYYVFSDSKLPINSKQGSSFGHLV